MRSTVLALAIGCLAIGGAIAANVALIGLVDHPQGRVGQLQLRLTRQPATPVTTAKPPVPALVVTPAPPPREEEGSGPDD